jgi:hypothetical protein
MPLGDALRFEVQARLTARGQSDTGSGCRPRRGLEPFFTTKPLGKGTGSASPTSTPSRARTGAGAVGVLAGPRRDLHLPLPCCREAPLPKERGERADPAGACCRRRRRARASGLRASSSGSAADRGGRRRMPELATAGCRSSRALRPSMPASMASSRCRVPSTWPAALVATGEIDGLRRERLERWARACSANLRSEDVSPRRELVAARQAPDAGCRPRSGRGRSASRGCALLRACAREPDLTDLLERHRHDPAPRSVPPRAAGATLISRRRSPSSRAASAAARARRGRGLYCSSRARAPSGCSSPTMITVSWAASPGDRLCAVFLRVAPGAVRGRRVSVGLTSCTAPAGGRRW